MNNGWLLIRSNEVLKSKKKKSHPRSLYPAKCPSKTINISWEDLSPADLPTGWRELIPDEKWVYRKKQKASEIVNIGINIKGHLFLLLIPLKDNWLFKANKITLYSGVYYIHRYKIIPKNWGKQNFTVVGLLYFNGNCNKLRMCSIIPRTNSKYICIYTYK